MGKIRIIGGNYRSRQLAVLDSAGLRPTLDRVKETLFNWLGQDLTGLCCLDLFAGSGSLGFEALSRNAKQVVMVESSPKVAKQLRHNLQVLDSSAGQVCHQDAFNYLANCQLRFDVIFLDPPYSSEFLAKSLALISSKLVVGGLVFIECLNLPDLSGYQLLKHSKAGSVNYALLSLLSDE